MADMPSVVTAKAAAKFVGLSESTLAKLRLNGNGPVYCKLGRRVVYRPADLERWLQSRTTRDTSDADARFLKALTMAHPRRRNDVLSPQFSVREINRGSDGEKNTIGDRPK
jgi:predicted DNA-binding transcriptional regulator AlpA